MKKISQYSFWFYRFIIVLIIILIVNFAGLISWIDYISDPPLRNANANDLVIGQEENLSLLDETLKKIFSEGSNGLGSEEKAIAVERFVAIQIKNENNRGNATKILLDNKAICGGKAIVFETLLRRLGIPSRLIRIFNMPSQGAHGLAEVYYDNDWHLFDPTFGLFVYSEPDYNQKGEILSLFEFKQETEKGYLFEVTDKLWVGQYLKEDANFGVKPLVNEDYSFLDKDFNNYWRKEIKAAHPISYGERSLYKYLFFIKELPGQLSG